MRINSNVYSVTGTETKILYIYEVAAPLMEALATGAG